MFGAVSVQIQYQTMEIIEIVEYFSPELGEFREGILLYRNNRDNRLSPTISYKEEVVGESPIAPTGKPLDLGVF